MTSSAVPFMPSPPSITFLHVTLFEVKWSEVAQSCPTLCGPVDCSLPGFSVHGILQARVLEWVTISFCRGSSQPRDWTRVSRIGGRCFNLWATREDFVYYLNIHHQYLSILFIYSLSNWSLLPTRTVTLRKQKTYLWPLNSQSSGHIGHT